ncbi:ABC transporter permease [Niveispirillum sp. KHB5.9]|uniref:ABC transporter permease n=1 Tax=Niveispirillum sp. KHB5.9 TaxID=3400269 RepID=UPI003A87822B
MTGFLIRRLFLALGVVLGATVAIFLLVQAIPGDPVSVALGPRATSEMRAHYRGMMGLDQPLPVQLWRFLARVVQGDLGTDIWSGLPVTGLLLDALPHTLALACAGLGTALVLGISLGCLGAARKGSMIDHAIGVASVSFIALPPFLVAIYSLLIFAVTLNWFPAIGAGEAGDLGSRLHALVLPAFAVGLGWVGYIARIVRSSLIEVMREKHVETARAFGLPPRMILQRYALRLALVPVVSIVGVGFGALLSGSVFAEIIFARPGIGRVVYDAVLARNFPVVSGAVVVTAGLYAIAMLVTDLVTGMLDHRTHAAL